MMMNLRTILAVAAAMVVVGCSPSNIKVSPQGNIVMDEREVGGSISSVYLEDGIEAVINQGTGTKIRVETFKNVQPFVEVVREASGALTVKVKPDTDFEGNPQIRVWITAQEFDVISISGGGAITASEKIGGHKISLALSGGSRFNAELNMLGSVSAVISGGSVLSLTGKSEMFELNASGGSQAYGFEFQSVNMNVNLSGGSVSRTSVSKELTLDVSGGSSLYYRGDPSLKVLNVSGGSNIIKDQPKNN